ncbi:hypothetical protein [Haliovirga abyssi]|uniref:Yip1 domain-containing protein n=1 Tax=Haliovirga abyssi TaxID=2996794 RepID=A0AAU9E3B3_9FUSO|nr:hypothetical protein [Haliovirga abyssi]BDU50940.1 hypothetical protein HLVA_15090 [Haliovirga abyssi]
MIKEKLTKSLEDLMLEDSFEKVIKKSFCSTFSLSFKPKTLLMLIILLFFIFLMTFIEVNSNKYILEIKEIVSHLNNISLYFITLVFTGYAIFQALLGENILKTLLVHSQNNTSKFKIYNYQFLGICIYILILLFFNFIIIFLLNNSMVVISLQSLNSKIKILIKIFFTTIYLIANIYLFFEMLLFFYNIYQAFSINAVQNGIDILKKSEK